LFQYFHDGLGSIVMICDSTGNYQNLYVYDDFGDFRMMEEAGSVPNSYYYTGQELDESPSGLYNLRARYYTTGIGRFTQEDPMLDVENGELGLNNCNHCRGLKINLLITSIERPQALNAYIYVINNPTNILDPTGEIVQIAFNPCLYCGACVGGAVFGCFVGCKYAPDYKKCVKECIKSIPCERLWPHKDDPVSGICFGMCSLCGLKIIGKDAPPLPNMWNK
jgi:RHS repeat-associated protein